MEDDERRGNYREGDQIRGEHEPKRAVSEDGAAMFCLPKIISPCARAESQIHPKNAQSGSTKSETVVLHQRRNSSRPDLWPGVAACMVTKL